MSKKVFYFILAVAVLGLVGSTLWYNWGSRDKNEMVPQTQEDVSGVALEIPENLMGMVLSEKQEGLPAVSMLNRMHGTDIKIDEGYILNYENQSGQALLYLSVSESEREAVELYRAMDDKMPVNKTFTGWEKLNIGRLAVIRVQGMGMEHYYWQQALINYWLAVQGDINPESLIQEVSNKVRHK